MGRTRTPEPADVAARWTAAWTAGDTGQLRRLLAADAAIESNLDGDFLRIAADFAAALDAAAVSAQTVSGNGIAVVYDCTAAGETFRLAEFLTIDEGRVREVRRVYDLDAVRRLLPHLVPRRTA
jgi:hypothetical protein